MIKGRPILYSCSWPAYLIAWQGLKANFSIIKKECNLWRTFWDIHDNWDSVSGIIDFFAKNQDEFSQYNGPEGWFDPDEIIIGDYGLSLEQSRSQMAFWALWSSPLLLSNDLRSIDPKHKDILQNKHLIDINQDPMRRMGKRVYQHIDDYISLEAWVKPVLPKHENETSLAIIYFCRNSMGGPIIVSHVELIL